MGIQYSATKLNPQPIAKSALPHGVVAFLRPLMSFDSLDPVSAHAVTTHRTGRLAKMSDKRLPLACLTA
jgi:hypothetical protein